MVVLNADQPQPAASSLADYLAQQSLAAAQAAAQEAQQKQYQSTSTDPTIPRWQTVREPVRLPNGAPTPTLRSRQVTRGVSVEDYMQEFYDKWDNPSFQTWFMSRTLAAGITNGKSTYEDYLSAWEKIGKTAASGYFKGTPEQYLEWAATGQQVSADEIRKEIETGTPVYDPVTDAAILPAYGTTDESGQSGDTVANPITTYKQTSSATINKDAAYAAADQIGQQLLGRMLTKAEMRKAYRVMNGMLAENPTVTTTTRDATDPNNVVESSHTKQGMSASEAEAALRQQMQRSSEGTAYTVGNMFEDAMKYLASKEG